MYLVHVFFAFYAISDIFIKNKNFGEGGKQNKFKINLFSFHVFFVFYAISNTFIRKKMFIFGNIEKCPIIYWLNGRWFLQIVDIGNLNMKLNGSKWEVVLCYFQHFCKTEFSRGGGGVNKMFVVLSSEPVGG